MYKLTNEGAKYLKSGLPERCLVKFLEDKGTVKVEDARTEISDFGIAIQWCKKYNCVEMKGGSISLRNPLPEETENIESALKLISSGKKPPESVVNILEKRNLAKPIRDDIETQAEKFVGKDVDRLNEALIKTGKWSEVNLKPYNVVATGPTRYPGRRQPYSRFLTGIKRKLVEIGFKEMLGPLIELEFWNFDALYQPQNHPSRDWTQTYSLNNPTKGELPKSKVVEQVKATHEDGWKTGSTGWGYEWSPDKAAKLMPRAHTTALSARYLAGDIEIPGKYFAISRCFRPDVIDATHGVEFNQMEGIVVADDLNFKDMLHLLKSFVIDFAGAEKVRFFPDYYPFTEPSVQVSAKHPELGWVEFAGAGIFREELTKPLGIEQPVIAWGFGIDRLAMYKLGINDIRYLFSQDLDWLRKKEVID